MFSPCASGTLLFFFFKEKGERRGRGGGGSVVGGVEDEGWKCCLRTLAVHRDETGTHTHTQSLSVHWQSEYTTDQSNGLCHKIPS